MPAAAAVKRRGSGIRCEHAQGAARDDRGSSRFFNQCVRWCAERGRCPGRRDGTFRVERPRACARSHKSHAPAGHDVWNRMKDHITFILVRSTNERFSKIVRTKHERCTPIRPHAFYENLHFRKLHFSLLQSADSFARSDTSCTERHFLQPSALCALCRTRRRRAGR